MGDTDGKVEAVWVGPFEGVLPDGTLVRPGDTARIPRGEAETSAFWQPTTAKRASAGKPDPESDD